MNRNKKDTNRKIFQRLEDKLPLNITGVRIGSSVPRWIASPTPEDSDTVEHAELRCAEACLPGRYAHLFRHGHRVYIALPADDGNSAPFAADIVARYTGSGLFVVLWADGQVGYAPISDIGHKIADEIFGTEKEYKIDIVKPFFAPNSIWEVDPTAANRDERATIYKTFGTYICRKKELSLPYEPQVLTKIEGLLGVNGNSYFIESVFRGLTAIHWEHAFLEFYRCIERLYAVPYIEDFRSLIQSNCLHAHVDISTAIDDSLNWRPREEEALVKLLTGITHPSILTNLHVVMGSITHGIANSPDSIAKVLYKVRNSIAHMRTDTPLAKKISAWNNLIECLCDIIDDRYKVYAAVV